MVRAVGGARSSFGPRRTISYAADRSAIAGAAEHGGAGRAGLAVFPAGAGAVYRGALSWLLLPDPRGLLGATLGTRPADVGAGGQRGVLHELAPGAHPAHRGGGGDRFRRRAAHRAGAPAVGAAGAADGQHRPEPGPAG